MSDLTICSHCGEVDDFPPVSISTLPNGNNKLEIVRKNTYIWVEED